MWHIHASSDVTHQMIQDSSDVTHQKIHRNDSVYLESQDRDILRCHRTRRDTSSDVSQDMWTCVTEHVWLNMCDWTCVTEHVWLNMCDWTCVTEHVWLNMCDTSDVTGLMSHVFSRSRRRSNLKYLDLQITTEILLDLLSAGDSVYSRENLLEILGTPVITCLICTGTPVKTCWKFWQS